MTRSRYDELHDRFDPIKTGKAGTRYERLAAMVLKALNDRDVVVHDMKLVGDSTVPHQIDVSIQRDGVEHRILVECKDFDRREAKVDLDIVRSFRSVIEDTGADEAIIVTCIGFTEPAETYARAKGIKLAILRTFEDADREGRLQKIVLRMHIRGIVRLEVQQVGFDAINHARFNAELAAAGLSEACGSDTPLHFVKDGEAVQFLDYVRRLAAADAGDSFEGERVLRASPDGWALSVAGGAPIAFEVLEIAYVMADETEISEITSDRIAELILSDLSGRDTIIYADQLARHHVGSDGTVR